MFYSDFSEDYEQIFPFSNGVFSFLRGYVPGENIKILDIGCATGHYSGKFAAEGFKTTGIDLDGDMINKALKTYPDANFYKMNLTDILQLKDNFGMVYSTGNVMAHVSEDEFKGFLSHLKIKMTDNGVWIFQVINWDYILQQKSFTFPEIRTKDKIFLRNYSDIGKGKLLFNTELRSMTEERVVFKDSVSLYPVNTQKYLSIHRDSGFELLGHFSDYSKTPFDPNRHSADIYVFRS